jgi:signal transduction histidine kinase
VKVRLRERWRISTFRLALLFGFLFIIGNIALLGLIYWQTTTYLERRIDTSIRVMLHGFRLNDPDAVRNQVREAIRNDLRRSNIYGLFTPDLHFICGNIYEFPTGLVLDDKVQQFQHQSLPQYSPGGVAAPLGKGLARALLRPIANGDMLVVGRDATQLSEIKEIILDALLGSGAVIMGLGLAGGFLLSIKPLRRISAIRETSRRIVQGELSLRMPLSGREDELDMLAAIVNLMLDEIERLLTEVKSVTDTLAHDLRTPLTRIRLLLHRCQQQLAPELPQHQVLDKALVETDALLGRFRALLRISEIENRQRKAGFAEIDPHEVVAHVAEMFEALAEDKGVRFVLLREPAAVIFADPDLLFEAISNLVDNAIKFTPVGGDVTLKLHAIDGVACIDVIDTGCGIAADERGTVLQRFYRSHRRQESEGFGLGLSIVAAILHLHGFSLEFQDSPVGTHITIVCAA